MNITDKKTLLTPAQKSLLEQCARKPFMLGGFVSLNDILTKLKVDVFIEPGKPERLVDGYYDKAIEYWKKALEQLRERMREDKSLEEVYRKLLERIERLYSEKKTHSSMMLLGQYDSQKNIIILYPEAMAAADASKLDEYLVSTFAHEVMHAYFDRPEHKDFPYAMFVEEPLAEFGMLLYLHETHSSYFNWAHDNVSGKNNCYHYGANIMDQYLDGDYFFRKCLEEYKIAVSEYEMLDITKGRISMPEDGGFVNVNGQTVAVRWMPANSVPPTFFWDEATKTLGLNGDWRNYLYKLSNHIEISTHYRFHGNDIQHVYFGKDFDKDRHNHQIDEFFSAVPVTVSPQHKELTSVNGIPVLKKDHTPVLHRCGGGYYELKRNGKYGIIDSQLKNITPFKYDYIGRFDENGLCKVRIVDHYGLVNKQGIEQVPVEYEDIVEKGHLYEVKQNGEKFTIDELGNKQSEKEE